MRINITDYDAHLMSKVSETGKGLRVASCTLLSLRSGDCRRLLLLLLRALLRPLRDPPENDSSLSRAMEDRSVERNAN